MKLFVIASALVSTLAVALSAPTLHGKALPAHVVQHVHFSRKPCTGENCPHMNGTKVGDGIRHEDGETQTDDWGHEYGEDAYEAPPGVDKHDKDYIYNETDGSSPGPADSKHPYVRDESPQPSKAAAADTSNKQDTGNKQDTSNKQAERKLKEAKAERKEAKQLRDEAARKEANAKRLHAEATRAGQQEQSSSDWIAPLFSLPLALGVSLYAVALPQ